MLKRAWGLSTELQQEPELTTELTCDKRQPLNAIKVSMLNGHDTSVCKDLLREVVDELAVDEAGKALADDVLHLRAHLLLLCLLYICHLHRHTPGQERMLRTCVSFWTSLVAQHFGRKCFANQKFWKPKGDVDCRIILPKPSAQGLWSGLRSSKYSPTPRRRIQKAFMCLIVIRRFKACGSKAFPPRFVYTF